MKALIKIYCLVAFLPLIIHGNNKIRKQLEEMANTNQSINGIFKPSTYIGQGGFGFTFKGTLLKPIEREVAMKFTPLKEGTRAETEYEAYTYLKAINNPDVERYGIPAVYYYGKWNDYILMAITLLDSEIGKRRDERKLNYVDIMILARDFVKISKYIHCHGVQHMDMKFDNLMCRKHQTFVIDFNTAGRSYRKKEYRRYGVPPNEIFLDRRKSASGDWVEFLFAVCADIGIDFYEMYNKEPLSKALNVDPNQCEILKNGGPLLIKEKLRQVVVEFFSYQQRLDGSYNETTRFQLYDQLYQFISAEIVKLQLPKPVLFSWLTDKDIEIAKEEFKNKPLPDISTIEDRFENINAEYPKVNFNYFTGELHREKSNPQIQASSSSTSYQHT